MLELIKTIVNLPKTQVTVAYFWLTCLGPLVYLFLKILETFDFQSFA
jgi:hypothetical protein